VEIAATDEAGFIPKDDFIGTWIRELDIEPGELIGLNNDWRLELYTHYFIKVSLKGV
jgi:hypothetical protein